MSNRDKKILMDAGLTVPELASFLRKSKQAVYQALAVDRHYLNEERLLKIYGKLLEESGSDERARARSFLNAVRSHAKEIDVRNKFERGYVHAVQSRYFIFAKEPYELRRTEYMDYMLKMIYPNAKVVAYFVADEHTAQRLVNKIRARASEYKTNKVAAAIYVISSSCVQLIPHLAITLNEPQGWSGLVMEVGEDEEGDAQLSEATVTAITDVLSFAGFSVTGAPPKFFPNVNPARYHGIEFLNHPVDL